MHPIKKEDEMETVKKGYPISQITLHFDLEIILLKADIVESLR
jgi:hypothetical protein